MENLECKHELCVIIEKTMIVPNEKILNNDLNNDQQITETTRCEHKKIENAEDIKILSRLASPLKMKTRGRPKKEYFREFYTIAEKDEPKKTMKKVAKAPKKSNTTIQNSSTQTIPIASESAENINTKDDPCINFKRRASEKLAELILKKDKLDNDMNQARSRIENATLQLYTKHQKIKSEIIEVDTKRKELKSAESLLAYDLCQYDELKLKVQADIIEFNKLAREKQNNRNKALEELKNEAIRSNEELMNQAWREYTESFQNSLVSSLKNVFDLEQ